MARTAKASEVEAESTQPETAPQTPQEGSEKASKRTRVPVPMVLAGVHELGAEEASEADIPVNRNAAPPLDGPLQDRIQAGLRRSFESGKWLVWRTTNVDAKAEIVKRLRKGAETLGYGVSIGNVTVSEVNGSPELRVPYKAQTRRQRRTKKADAE